MSFNGSGVFVINSIGQPVATGTVISSTAFNALTADLATGLSTTITKDGQSTPTANIPMGGFKLTGLAVATTSGDALSYGQAATVSALTVGTLTGLLKAATGVVSAATAGTDYVAPGTATNFTALQTFSGSTASLAAKLVNAKETETISATAATGTINYDITTQSILYYTTNAAANWTVNLRANGSNSLDSLMSTGETVTVVFKVTQGGTAYYNTTVQVDGTTSGVTTRWLGGAPSFGLINGIDVYTYAITKTGSATFSILASRGSFN